MAAGHDLGARARLGEPHGPRRSSGWEGERSERLSALGSSVQRSCRHCWGWPSLTGD